MVETFSSRPRGAIRSTEEAGTVVPGVRQEEVGTVVPGARQAEASVIDTIEMETPRYIPEMVTDHENGEVRIEGEAFQPDSTPAGKGAFGYVILAKAKSGPPRTMAIKVARLRFSQEEISTLTGDRQKERAKQANEVILNGFRREMKALWDYGPRIEEEIKKNRPEVAKDKHEIGMAQLKAVETLDLNDNQVPLAEAENIRMAIEYAGNPCNAGFIVSREYITKILKEKEPNKEVTREDIDQALVDHEYFPKMMAVLTRPGSAGELLLAMKRLGMTHGDLKEDNVLMKGDFQKLVFEKELTLEDIQTGMKDELRLLAIDFGTVEMVGDKVPDTYPCTPPYHELFDWMVDEEGKRLEGLRNHESRDALAWNYMIANRFLQAIEAPLLPNMSVHGIKNEVEGNGSTDARLTDELDFHIRQEVMEELAKEGLLPPEFFEMFSLGIRHEEIMEQIEEARPAAREAVLAILSNLEENQEERAEIMSDISKLVEKHLPALARKYSAHIVRELSDIVAGLDKGDVSAIVALQENAQDKQIGTKLFSGMVDMIARTRANGEVIKLFQDKRPTMEQLNTAWMDYFKGLTPEKIARIREVMVKIDQDHEEIKTEYGPTMVDPIVDSSI